MACGYCIATPQRVAHRRRPSPARTAAAGHRSDFGALENLNQQRQRPFSHGSARHPYHTAAAIAPVWARFASTIVIEILVVRDRSTSWQAT